MYVREKIRRRLKSTGMCGMFMVEGPAYTKASRQEGPALKVKEMQGDWNTIKNYPQTGIIGERVVQK